jgi:Rho termination factor, N-terminal domain
VPARTAIDTDPQRYLHGIVDRAFDVAEQILAAQHQLARSFVGVATRQVDTALETVDTSVAAIETTVDERVRQQDRRPDGRTYEERSVEELRERAGELQIEGRSAMNKDELVTALRNHRKARSAKSDARKQERQQAK